MIQLETKAKVILTDSGGVQKKVFFARVPCITVREETEWEELVKQGYNLIAGCKPADIRSAFLLMVNKVVTGDRELYGGGRASGRVVKVREKIKQ